MTRQGCLIVAYDQSSNAAVYSYDAVGNLLSIGNDPSTQPSAFKLSSNTALAGSTITIYGTDFCSNPAVTFNGISATIVSASSTQIVAIVLPERRPAICRYPAGLITAISEISP